MAGPRHCRTERAGYEICTAVKFSVAIISAYLFVLSVKYSLCFIPLDGTTNRKVL